MRTTPTNHTLWSVKLKKQNKKTALYVEVCCTFHPSIAHATWSIHTMYVMALVSIVDFKFYIR